MCPQPPCRASPRALPARRPARSAQIPAPARSSAAPGRPRPMARRRAASASGTPAAQVRGGTLPACSALQLALELVEEAPVGALRDDLLRARLDHAGLGQAKRIET